MSKTQPDQSMRPETIALRRARVEDAPAMLQLLAAAGSPLEGVEEHILNSFVAEETAVNEPRLVGCAAIEVHGAAGLLRSVAVVPEWRGHRIAERLCGEVIKFARDLGLREIALLTVSAQGFFARLGFKSVCRTEIDPDLLEARQFSLADCSGEEVVCMSVALGCKPTGMQLKRGL